MPIFTEGQDPTDEPPREPTVNDLYVQGLRSELKKTIAKLDQDPDGIAARHMVLLLQDIAAATRSTYPFPNPDPE
jgi:hypothetical protein